MSTTLSSHSPGVQSSAMEPRTGDPSPNPPPVRGPLSESAVSSPADTAPRAVIPPAARGDNFALFEDRGDYAAFNACKAWLEARGFSVGPLQGNSPVKAMLGDAEEVKAWKFQSAEDLNDLHVKIMPKGLAASMRGGPVIAQLRSTVHSGVAAAFRSDPVDTAAREHVEGVAS